MLTRRDVLKALPIGFAAISLPIITNPTIGYSTRFIVQSHNYGQHIAVGIECKRGAEVKRMGILCDGDEQVPQVKTLLQHWADDGCPPFNTYRWRLV